MKKYRIYIIAITVGAIIMPHAIRAAQAFRTHMETGRGTGGEWLIIPLFITIAQLLSDIRKEQKKSAPKRKLTYTKECERATTTHNQIISRNSY